MYANLPLKFAPESEILSYVFDTFISTIYM